MARVQPAAGRAALEAAVTRWPASPLAWFAQGNAALASNDVTQAEHGFRRAVALDERFADGWNNLAVVLARRDRPAEAREAIERAIALGGPRREVYEATRREIGAAALQTTPR